MKILITVPIFASGGGITRYILSLCRIFSPEHSICLIETHAKVKSQAIEKELKSINPSISYIVTGNRNKLFNYLSNIYYAIKFNPDIIVSNFNGLTQFILPIIKRKAKVIHIIHSAASEFYDTATINARFVDRWIAPTKGIQTLFNAYTDNQYSARVTVVHHGVDDASCSDTRDSHPLEICFVGVVDQHKGILVVPEIIKDVLRQGIDLRITVIGEGGKEDWVKEQLAEEYDAGILRMTGGLPHNQVYDYLAKSDIFLYPTHLDAFGLVIAEAMINGAVPLVTLLDGITDDLVEDGKSGFLFRRDDINAFADRIVQLATDRPLLSRMSMEAKTRAEKLFSLNTMKRNYLRLINEL